VKFYIKSINKPINVKRLKKLYNCKEMVSLLSLHWLIMLM